MSKIQKDLRKKGKVEFEGIILMYAGEWPLLKPGDTYIAEKDNEGPKLLTVDKIEKTLDKHSRWHGSVFPKEKDPAYDLYDCVKVIVHIEGE